MDYDIEYDEILGCFTLHYDGEIICLGAATHSEALEEAAYTVETWRE